MKRVVLLALIAAICAGALLYSYLGQLEQQKQVQVVYENVVIAATDIPAYSTITAEMITFKQMPEGSAHPYAARSIDEVIGYVTESDIIAGEEILPSKLKQLGQTESGLSYIIPEGMRAITVAVDEISGIGGFIQRGDYVDILSYTTTSYQPESTDPTLTEEEAAAQEATGTQATTVVVAQNICIAAIGTSLANVSSSSTDGSVGYGSVTLYVTPEDAMRVIQAEKSGAIILALRASNDHTPNDQDPVINDILLEKAK